MGIGVCGMRLVGLDDLLDGHSRLLTSTKDGAKADQLIMEVASPQASKHLCGHLITLSLDNAPMSQDVQLHSFSPRAYNAYLQLQWT